MNNHVIDRLNDYVDNALTTAECSEIERHLELCGDCRNELQSMRNLLKESEQLPRAIQPNSDLWPGIQDRIQSAQGEARIPADDKVLDTKPLFRFGGARLLRTPLAVAAVVLLAWVGFWVYDQLTTPSWRIAVVEGAARVGSDLLEGEGNIRVGDLLETNDASRARIQVGAIGHVEVEPQTRIRVLGASLTDHRIALDEGTIRAMIFAPPRLFFVETPSALAVDLGCIYTLNVDGIGASILHVTSGWVSLEFNGRASVVPAGAVCVTRPGYGPGTPYQEDASETLKTALMLYDFDNGGSDALQTVLRNTRNMDSITLWHLFFRTTAAEREKVYDRLAHLVYPPEGVTRDGMLGGEPEMIAKWQKHLNLGQKSWWRVF